MTAVTVVVAAMALSASAWASVPDRTGGPRAPGIAAGGQLVWEGRDAGPHNAFDTVGGMAVSPDGSTIYVARGSNGLFVVVARDAVTGSVLWRVRTSDPGGGQLSAEAAALSPDGTVLYVTGASEIDVDTRDTLTVAYKTNGGAVIWETERGLGAKSLSLPTRIAVSPGGARVFVAGTQLAAPADDYDYFTVGYDTATGGEAWTSIFDGSGGFSDILSGLDVSPDGTRVFVTGRSAAPAPSNFDFATVAYQASNGAQDWAMRYDVGIDDSAADVVASPQGGRVFVVGSARDSTSVPYGYRLVAYRATDGTQTQSTRYDDGRNEFANDLAVSASGSKLYATGGATDFLTVAFLASTLKELWATPYDGGHGFDRAAAAAVSPDGAHVYVTGESQRVFMTCFGEVESTAYATVQYDATSGAQGWVSRYNGRNKDPDQPHQVATSPDGSLVYVTGDSDTGCVGSDVATLAYQA
jgi:DNA-binding beta-propeller fold protein YncE